MSLRRRSRRLTSPPHPPSPLPRRRTEATTAPRTAPRAPPRARRTPRPPGGGTRGAWAPPPSRTLTPAVAAPRRRGPPRPRRGHRRLRRRVGRRHELAGGLLRGEGAGEPPARDEFRPGHGVARGAPPRTRPRPRVVGGLRAGSRPVRRLAARRVPLRALVAVGQPREAPRARRQPTRVLPPNRRGVAPVGAAPRRRVRPSRSPAEANNTGANNTRGTANTTGVPPGPRRGRSGTRARRPGTAPPRGSARTRTKCFTGVRRRRRTTARGARRRR